MRHVFTLAATAVLTVAVGCGRSDKRAEVSGKVTVTGKGSLPGGTITFVRSADSMRIGSGVIGADGAYRVADAPVGDCKVVVDNSHLDPAARKVNMPGMGAPGSMGGMPGMKGGPVAPGSKGPPSEAKSKMGAAPKDLGESSGTGQSETSDSKHVKIDASYSKAESTTLRAEVGTGSNSFDFEVK